MPNEIRRDSWIEKIEPREDGLVDVTIRKPDGTHATITVNQFSLVAMQRERARGTRVRGTVPLCL